MKSDLETTVAAIKVGVNQFLGGGSPASIKEALGKNLLKESDLDAALRGKYKTIIKLGLLDPPEMVPYTKIGTAGEPEPWNSEKHKSVAKLVALESTVLLKNAGGFLPLDQKKTKSIAVIGTLADKVHYDLYSGTTPYSISILEGVKNKAGDSIAVTFAPNNDNNAAVNAAKSADVAIVVIGNDPLCGADMKSPVGMFNQDASTKKCAVPGEGREGRDRESIDLPSEELAKLVYAANPRTVMVLISSFPYAINWSQANVPAILHITHAAQEQGAAIADILFGGYNPAGRLVQTWPKSLDQLPPIEDYNLRNGRTYMYFKGEPLYPFGHGLSFTSFSYSNVKLSSSTLKINATLTVKVQVRNSGKRAGEEVVQLYA